MTGTLRDGGLLLVGLGSFLVVWRLFCVRTVPPPTAGPRGAERSRARMEYEWFRNAEPAILLLAAWSHGVPLGRIRKLFDEKLRLAGHWLGLSGDEFVGLSTLAALVGGALGALLSASSPDWTGIAVLIPLVVSVYPYARLTTLIDNRHIAVGHGLPSSIDLLALSIGAGLDFPSAVRGIVDNAPDLHDPLIAEYRQILRDLELGRTRREALSGFAERVPIEAVKDFVSTVIQAEEKGNPLGTVLSIQARVMRDRRTVIAEESAAKAAGLLMGPLALVLACLMIIVMVPMVFELMVNLSQ